MPSGPPCRAGSLATASPSRTRRASASLTPQIRAACFAANGRIGSCATSAASRSVNSSSRIRYRRSDGGAPCGSGSGGPSAARMRLVRWRGPSHLSGRVLSGARSGRPVAPPRAISAPDGRRSPIARGGNPLPLALRSAPLFRHARRALRPADRRRPSPQVWGSSSRGCPSPGVRDPHPGGGGLVAAAVAMVVVMAFRVRSDAAWPTGQEPCADWLPALADPYPRSEWTQPVAYVYSPAFLQGLAVLKALPWRHSWRRGRPSSSSPCVTSWALACGPWASHSQPSRSWGATSTCSCSPRSSPGSANRPPGRSSS